MTFGNIGVALFFMLSGALLWANYQYEFDTLIFYKKRLLKICIPQYIGFIGAIIVSYITYSGYISNLIHGGIKSWIGFFLSFFGLTLAGNVYDVLGISTVWIIGEWFCTSQQKVDTFFIFYTLKTEHSTPYIVLVSNSLMSMQVFLH